MAETNSIIETGVDKLVKLVKDSGRISMPDAAKQLGVSNEVVEEWADFLEEEGIVSIEHSLTKPYLVERKLTKIEVEKKEKEFTGKKDVFIRKAEVTVNLLGKEAEKLKGVKAEFDKIKKELGWRPKYDFDKGLDMTIDWYLKNKEWWKKIKSGEYKRYYKKNNRVAKAI